MRHNGSVTTPELAPRNTHVGVVVVWALVALATLAIGTVVPVETRGTWIPVAFGFVILVSFAVQLWYGRSQNFLVRVAASVLGGLLVMALIGVGLGLAAMFAG